MESIPSPFNTAQGRFGRPPSPGPQDTPYEASAKRQALRRWYDSRRQAQRTRREQRAQRKAERTNTGYSSFDIMGRWAINQAVSLEADPAVRRRRRMYLMQKWRTFMRQTFNRQPK